MANVQNRGAGDIGDRGTGDQRNPPPSDKRIAAPKPAPPNNGPLPPNTVPGHSSSDF